jgi:hypothetical protein
MPRMRLKPLRGQTYASTVGEIVFLEKQSGADGWCNVLIKDARYSMPINNIVLPIIDTKDYEKIEDRKYKGD